MLFSPATQVVAPVMEKQVTSQAYDVAMAMYRVAVRVMEHHDWLRPTRAGFDSARGWLTLRQVAEEVSGMYLPVISLDDASALAGETKYSVEEWIRGCGR